MPILPASFYARAYSTLATSLLALSALTVHSSAQAVVTVQVLDAAGAPVPNAVVYAEPLAPQSLPKALKTAEIEQKDTKFFPLVSVVQVGTPIQFPNHDKVRHHVYSFSPAKTFELKLYSGAAASPVVFDKAGTVVLGCNIHDQMVAYVQVVNTPYFAKTDMAGRARLDGLAQGKYALKAWYFTMAPDAVIEQPLSYQGGELAAAVKLAVKAVPVQ